MQNFIEAFPKKSILHCSALIFSFVLIISAQDINNLDHKHQEVTSLQNQHQQETHHQNHQDHSDEHQQHDGNQHSGHHEPIHNHHLEPHVSLSLEAVSASEQPRPTQSDAAIVNAHQDTTIATVGPTTTPAPQTNRVPYRSEQLQQQQQQQQQPQPQPAKQSNFDKAPYATTQTAEHQQAPQQMISRQPQQQAQAPQQSYQNIVMDPQRPAPMPIQEQQERRVPVQPTIMNKYRQQVAMLQQQQNVLDQQHQQMSNTQQQQQQQPSRQQMSAGSFSQAPTGYHHSMPLSPPLYLGHNPFIEILRPLSYADDNIVTLNLSHSHIYEIDSDAFVGQRFEHIDLSNNKLGLIHSRSFRIGPNHSKHTPFNPGSSSSSSSSQLNMMLTNSSNAAKSYLNTRRPPPAHPKSVTIDFSHNPAIVALSGAFDHIDVPNCLLNFTNSTVELKFGAFKKYFKEHPGHIIDIDSVDCCEQEWLLGYKHNFVSRTHCDHDLTLLLSKVPQQTIIDSCIAYVTSARHSMNFQGPSIIHQVAATPRHHPNTHSDNQYLTYLILGGTAMILTSLSIYIIFYMFSLKAAFVYQMQSHKS